MTESRGRGLVISPDSLLGDCRDGDLIALRYHYPEVIQLDDVPREADLDGLISVAWQATDGTCEGITTLSVRTQVRLLYRPRRSADDSSW
jgi:hypothetical protein